MCHGYRERGGCPIVALVTGPCLPIIFLTSYMEASSSVIAVDIFLCHYSYIPCKYSLICHDDNISCRH